MPASNRQDPHISFGVLLQAWMLADAKAHPIANLHANSNGVGHDAALVFAKGLCKAFMIGSNQKLEDKQI